MARFRRQKGQSTVELALIMPFFLLVALGLAQLCLITTAAIMLKYTAYMSARTAVAASNREEAASSAGEAALILNLMASRSLYNAGLLPALTGAGVEISEEKMNSASSRYIRVTVHYNFPLKVPFVNRLFGMYKGFNDPAALAAGLSGLPYFPLRASCVMMAR
ncbi:MAG: TadE family protein [Candidatus Goldiibacteriota bacterium]|jgi:Flp pilus assembly protein TadG